MNFIIHPIVVLAMSSLNVYLDFQKWTLFVTENFVACMFLFVNQICKQKLAIHVSFTCYCNNHIIQITAPFSCFAANYTYHIILVFLQQWMTVNGDAFLIKMVSDNLARHNVATPTYLWCKQAAYKNCIQML